MKTLLTSLWLVLGLASSQAAEPYRITLTSSSKQIHLDRFLVQKLAVPVFLCRRDRTMLSTHSHLYHRDLVLSLSVALAEAAAVAL